MSAWHSNDHLCAFILTRYDLFTFRIHYNSPYYVFMYTLQFWYAHYFSQYAPVSHKCAIAVFD